MTLFRILEEFACDFVGFLSFFCFGFIGSISSSYVLANGLTGIDGWFFTNVNFVITIAYILSLLAVGYFGLR